MWSYVETAARRIRNVDLPSWIRVGSSTLGWMRTIVAFTLLCGLCASAHADGKRLGFANLSQSSESLSSLDALRTRVELQGYEVLHVGALRKALEAPLPPPMAESIVAQARALTRTAKDAYADFAYELALTRLGAVDALLIALEPKAEVVAGLADRHLLAGLVYAGMDDDSRMSAAFRLVQDLRPAQTTLDPGLYRPRIVKEYGRARQLARPGRATTFRSEPAGATLWIDGRLVGPTPQTVTSLRAGTHYVAAVKSGYQPSAAILDIPPATTESRVEPTEPANQSPLSRVFYLVEKPAAQRIVELRRQLLANTNTVDWTAVGNSLTKLVNVDVLILLRDGERELEAAIFQGGQLGPWMPAPSVDLSTPPPETLDARLAVKQYMDRKIQFYLTNGSPHQPLLTGEQTALVGIDTDGRRPHSWYRTWWGAMLIGGGVAVVGVVTYALIEHRDTRYRIGDVCFGREACP